MPETLKELAQAAETEWLRSFPRPELHLIAVATDSIKRARVFSDVFILWKRNPLKPEQLHPDILVGNEEGVEKVNNLIKLAAAIRQEQKLTIEAARGAEAISLDRKRLAWETAERRDEEQRDDANSFLDGVNEEAESKPRSTGPGNVHGRVRRDARALRGEVMDIEVEMDGIA